MCKLCAFIVWGFQVAMLLDAAKQDAKEVKIKKFPDSSKTASPLLNPQR